MPTGTEHTPRLEPGSRKAPLLIVDDDPMIRRVMQASIEQLGLRADLAGNITDAKQLLRNNPYSLILSDFEMPGGSGLDLLRYVTRMYPTLPFVMLTGHDEAELARQAITRGALDFLAKPFDVGQLERVLEQNWARLERERKHASQLSYHILKGTIQALVAAVDAKDPHTARHSERVAMLSMRLGQAIGLSPDELRLLEFSALLHDVGKIGVPEAVLLKPGPLNETEWEIIREHPIRGAEIVGQVGALGEVASIVLHHHERWDGNGYPDGLGREAIPLFSRIITLADVYEALTSARSYRPARPPAEAKKVIRGDLDTHFEASMGQLFLELENLP